MLNLIADHPILFGLSICIITGIPMVLWWLRYSKSQERAKSSFPGIQFTWICGKTLPSKIKFDTHQQDGSCPKFPVNSDAKPAPKSVPASIKSKPPPLQKPIVQSKKAEAIQPKKKKEASKKNLRKTIKIKPRTLKEDTQSEIDEDVIFINKFEKNKAKIVISKR